jgi:hypothetical protein
MRLMVFDIVAFVSKNTGATLQAIYLSVGLSYVTYMLFRLSVWGSPATLTLGSHDFAMAEW